MEKVLSVQETSGCARRRLAAVAAGFALVGSCLAGCAGEKDATSRDQSVPPVTVPAIEVPAFPDTNETLLDTYTPSNGERLEVYGIKGQDNSMYVHVPSNGNVYTGLLKAECNPGLSTQAMLWANNGPGDEAGKAMVYTMTPPPNLDPCIGGKNTLVDNPQNAGALVIAMLATEVRYRQTPQQGSWGSIFPGA
jgi:hypothetical protein